MKTEKGTLSSLLPGQSGIVKYIGSCGGLGGRLRDMGLSEGCRVSCICKSPLGDPAAYSIRGAVIAIRSTDARGVGIRWD